MPNFYKPIPISPEDYKCAHILTKECGEKLTSIGKLNSKNIIVESQYYLAGISGALPDCYARESVCELLLKASKLLPNNYKLVIWDAWRPYEVQKHLFDSYYNKNKLQFPNVDENELIAITRKFVALPSIDVNNPSPHVTGGAIDLSIMDDKNNYLKMGTEFDHFGKESNTTYYEEKFNSKTITNEEINYLDNRRLLFNCITSVGFTNYYDEWWHYNYGNKPWAEITGKDAIYGLADQNMDEIQ